MVRAFVFCPDDISQLVKIDNELLTTACQCETVSQLLSFEFSPFQEYSTLLQDEQFRTMCAHIGQLHSQECGLVHVFPSNVTNLGCSRKMYECISDIVVSIQCITRMEDATHP